MLAAGREITVRSPSMADGSLHFATSLQLPANERPHRDFKYEVIVVADKIAGGWQDLRNGEFRSTAIYR